MAEVTWQTNYGDKVVIWRSLQMHAPSLTLPDGTFTVDGSNIATVEVWYWHVVARNGRVLEQGEGHTRRRDAVRAALRHHPRVES